MSNPFTQVYDDLRSPYLQEKKAKKDYDGDGKVESGSKEHAGVVHNAIQKKKGGKPDGQDTRSEGTAYGIYKGDGKVRIGRKQEEKKKPPRTAKGAMAYDGPNKAASEARDRVIAKTKAKRAKLKKEDWRADLGLEIVEHHQKDENGNVIEHEDEADGTPSSVEEATKGEKLDIKTTGVKNKIEINPEMKTEGYGGMAKKKKKKFSESLKQARKNIGMNPNKPSCWKGYKATGTKMKGGKQVPDCKKESLMDKVESDAIKMFNAK